MEFSHKTVLLNESIDYLMTDPDGIYVDGTLGGAGHSKLICTRLGENGRLIGFDQDADAIATAKERLAPWQEKVTVIHSNFSRMKSELAERGIYEVDGILLDLGVSSHQLDTIGRGFSYRDEESPLDMRMDRRQSMTARDILMTYSEAELTRVLKKYGEERFARNIARNIVAERERYLSEAGSKDKAGHNSEAGSKDEAGHNSSAGNINEEGNIAGNEPFRTTGELNEIIRRSIPAKYRKNGGHPSKRTFQALRIELNGELDVLENTLSDMIGLLKPGGRICVITFHSLEDRIVKTIFRKKENPCTCPPDFPVCVCGKVPEGKMITRKPVLPSDEELTENKRAKSAKLRVFEKAESL